MKIFFGLSIFKTIFFVRICHAITHPLTTNPTIIKTRSPKKLIIETSD